MAKGVFGLIAFIQFPIVHDFHNIHDKLLAFSFVSAKVSALSNDTLASCKDPRQAR